MKRFIDCEKYKHGDALGDLPELPVAQPPVVETITI
jgi:hypothetical protein